MSIIKINSRPLESSDLKRLDKLDREHLASGYQSQKDIRVQLSEQLKCLDGRLDTQQAIVSEIQDVFRRRADIEANYSKELDKLAKYLTNRHKEQRQKRDAWSLHSSTQIWETLASHTKKTAKDHRATSEIYASHVVHRCNQINEDLQRVYRRCREIGYEIHEEVIKALHELHTTLKTHQSYQSEFRQTESKLQVVEKQRNKLEQSVPLEKRAKHRKFRLLDKEYLKRKLKFEEARLSATKARNEYLLAMDAANASIQKYFVDDLSDLIDCMDFGFHQSLSRAVHMHTSGLEQQKKSLQKQVDQISKILTGLDSRLDKQKFIEFNNNTFMIPKKFELAQTRRDETEVIVQKCVLDELSSRKLTLAERLTQIKAESEEIWKSMDSAEKTLADIVGCKDYDTTRFFVEEDRASLRSSDSIVLKQKADRLETEEFYINKFREYVINSNRVARLQAKYDNIRLVLGDKSAAHMHPEGLLTLTRRPNVARRRRIGNTSRQGQPKLFGGSLEEYLEETNQDIPTVVRSCVRVINLYGLHHHGIFRVSGSQVEINNFRDAFERGDDPLADMSDASDINSVAGVMKLYLRELREPVFPIQYFDHFMELAQLESKHEFVLKVREVVQNWPRAVFIVMRYIFSFLNHLSEFSDENMMDPYNLAICFGPTLVPIPEERDQVQFQNLVNELIKNFIIFHEDIFPTSVPGPIYEKYITNEPEEMEDSPPDQLQDDLDVESEMAEDEGDSVFSGQSGRDGLRDISLELFGKSEVLEALAVYDFKARSSREVTFHKGDTIHLFKQVSNDWWRGRVHGQEGLIPDKYIMLKIKGEDDTQSTRERLESARSFDERSAMRYRSLSLDLRSRTASNASEAHVGAPSLSPSSPVRGPPGTSIPPEGVVPPLSHSAVSTTTPVEDDSVDSGHLVASSSDVTTPSRSEVIPHRPLEGGRLSESSRTDEGLSSPEDPLSEVTSASSHVVTSAQTHIIRVTGPVTNLDETVVSAEGANGAMVISTHRRSTPTGHPEADQRRSIGSRPSAALAELEHDGDDRPALSLLREGNASQESLASSTDSNRELQKHLKCTIDQVEAFTQEVEKRKKAKSVPEEDASPQSVGGARPKAWGAASSHRPEEGVVLKQQSWGSRELHAKSSLVTITSASDGAASDQPGGASADSSSGVAGGKTFSQNKNMWEKRTTVEEAPSGPGFRSNRSFWEHKARDKQTPDLVLDLPVSSSPSQPTGATMASPSTELATTPVPKPRTLTTNGGSTLPLASLGPPPAKSVEPVRQAVAVKPQVRVKPHSRTPPHEKE